MAFAAINIFVAAGEFIAGKVVFEIFLIKTHHVKFSTVVVAVATGAILAFYLRRGVVAHIPVDAVLDLLVAGHTFVVRQLIPDVVALGTIRHALQAFVRVRQVAGRQLSNGLTRETGQKKQYIKNSLHVTCVF